MEEQGVDRAGNGRSASQTRQRSKALKATAFLEEHRSCVLATGCVTGCGYSGALVRSAAGGPGHPKRGAVTRRAFETGDSDIDSPNAVCAVTKGAHCSRLEPRLWSAGNGEGAGAPRCRRSPRGRNPVACTASGSESCPGRVRSRRQRQEGSGRGDTVRLLARSILRGVGRAAGSARRSAGSGTKVLVPGGGVGETRRTSGRL